MENRFEIKSIDWCQLYRFSDRLLSVLHFVHVMTLKSTKKLLHFNNRTVVNEIKQHEQHVDEHHS